MTAILIDDEIHCLETLQWKLKEYCPDVEVEGKFESPIEALEFLQDHSPDVIFLDIEMPKITGFDLLKLKKNLNSKIVLTTAFEKYALAALKLGVFDYLLKPVDYKELIVVIEKVKTTQTKEDKGRYFNKNVISIATQESIEFIIPDEILYCQAQSNYSIVHFVNKRKKMTSKTLKDIESQLSEFSFFRTHQSYLINLKYIKEIRKSDFGQLVLNDGTSIPITRSKKNELFELLK